MHHRIMVHSGWESTNEIARFGLLKSQIPAISNASESEKQTPVQSLSGLFTDDYLKRDEIKLNRHRALDSCLRMIFSENRFTLFRIMLQSRKLNQAGGSAVKILASTD